MHFVIIVPSDRRGQTQSLSYEIEQGSAV